MPRIDEMYAFVSLDANGDEGVCAHFSPSYGWMPLVGGDMSRVESIRPLAVNIAKQSGMKITLVKFTGRTEVEVINRAN